MAAGPRRLRWPGAVGLKDLADLPAAYLSAGQRRRLSLARLAAVQRPSGCSTSRSRRSTVTGKGGSRTWMPATSRRRRADRRRDPWPDRAGARPGAAARGHRMNALAALFVARRTARDPRRRRRRHRRAVLPDRGRAHAVRHRPDLALLGPHRTGDPLAWRAAREPAHARSVVRGRSGGRLARPDPDGRHAARTDARGEGAGALAHQRTSARHRHAAARPVHEPRRPEPAPRSR